MSDHSRGSYRELLSSGKVDAVIIASENARHFEQVSAAAAAGVHIICQKPVGINREQLEIALKLW